MKQIYAEQVAAKLHICVGSLLNRRNKTPHLAPPARRIPGTRRLIWIEEEVDAWIVEHAHLEPTVQPPAATQKNNNETATTRPRGRPRKLSRLEQRALQQQREGGAA